jgi:hypothetical protein
MDTGEEVRIDDIGRAAFDDRLLVLVAGSRLRRRNEGGTDIREIGAHRLGREHSLAGRYRP